MSKDFILDETLRLLNERYPIGLYEYLYKHREDLYRELLALEDRIDKAFLSGTVEELKSVLREYWTFHMRAKREFKQTDLNLVQIRKEMNEERIQA
ncbi:MAG TPA: hypothetical protein VHT73_13515 [Thermodesulfobacteriota bacterium]|nr:hypothetical protein [Thermodesulfobacteriota bacterium]